MGFNWLTEFILVVIIHLPAYRIDAVFPAVKRSFGE